MSVERKEEEQQTQMISSRGIAYWTMFPKQIFPTCLTLNPEPAYKPGSYEDMQSEFSPLLFSSMESYLTPFLKNFVCDSIKFGQMRRVMHEYLPEGELTRVQGHKRYRQKIISNYQPLHGELYTMHAANFFVPSFLKAVNENTEESFRSIMREPSRGVFTFEMLQPRFCELLMSEVENFERWVHETKFRIMRPNTMNKYGVVLDDFGLENMLEKLMEDFIRPISTVFFPEVGGSTLDSHHGFVVEYGKQRDLKLGGSLFRELNRYQSDFSSWCGECQRVKKEAHEDQLLMKRSLLKTKLKPMRRGGGIVKEATL